MQILVTGGTGVVGVAAVRALLARGHAVRLLSRHAEEDARRWDDRVETRNGSVADAAAVREAAAGCDAVLHVAGIVAEQPPDVTFEAVNVDGTRHVVDAAIAAGAARLVHVSSLGCDRGASRYHASKREAERLVRAAPLRWTIVRPGNVYGPGDEVVSQLVQMVRGLPVLPLIGDGEQPFQPIAGDDLGLALALTVERDDLDGEVLELAGPEVTSMRDLLDRLARLIGRDPVRLPVPTPLLAAASRLVSVIGLPAPVDEEKLTMLAEGNLLAPGEANALVDVFGLEPTPLDDGLRALLATLPPQLPASDGTPLVRRRWRSAPWLSQRRAEDVLAHVRRHFVELLPESSRARADDDVTPRALEPGTVLALDLPLRGQVSVRVATVAPHEVVLLTLAGHMLSGTVTLRCEPMASERLYFEVETCDQPSTLIDAAAMALGGVLVKSATWHTVVQNAVAHAGGPAQVDVELHEDELRGEAARRVCARMAELVDAQERLAERHREELLQARCELAAAGP